MSTGNILIERGASLDKWRLRLVDALSNDSPFFSICICRLDDVSENCFWATAVKSKQAGEILADDIAGMQEGDIYCLYVSCEKKYTFGFSPNLETLILQQYFQVSNNEVTLMSKAEGEKKREKQRQKNISSFYAVDGHSPGAIAHQVVIFFAGVELHNSSAIKGISLQPVSPGLSNSATFEAVETFLLKQHDATILTGAALDPYLRYQPMFAMTFHEIFALTEDSALNFASNLSQDISTIISCERGDRPFPVLTFLLETETAKWKVISRDVARRGNLLPPMFGIVNASQIERRYPILQSQPFARLVLELFSQSLAERDKSFRFLRQWSLLELISEKRIDTSNTPLVNLDDSEICLSSGTRLTTRRKEGKVYKYLRESGLPAIYQGVEGAPSEVIEGSRGGRDQGGGVVSLWEAVAVIYEIRNAVIHEGRFIPKNSSQNNRDILCAQFYSGRFGFIEHALSHAVDSEMSIDEHGNTAIN